MNKLLSVERLNVEIPQVEGILNPVCDVSFYINQGETLGIVGESGCGKSLTAFALMGLLPRMAIRRAESLFFCNQDLLSLNNRQMDRIRGHKMAMIFQEPMTSLNPCYTIGNQLTEALRMHLKIDNNQARQRAIEVMEKVGISAAAYRLKQYPHQLSGGLRQRVMIAMALLCRPELIIADEPTTALDVTIQAQILAILSNLKQEFDMSMLFITHDLGVISRVADRVMVMYAGQVVESGSVKAIFSQPLHPYTQGLMKCIPVPGETKRGKPLGTIAGFVPLLTGGMRGCRFHDRCPRAFDDCLGLRVPLHKGEENHQYRCLHPPEKLKSGSQNKVQ